MIRPLHSLWFKRSLYLYVLISCAYWIAKRDLLFGEHSMVYKSAQSAQGSDQLAFILYMHQELAVGALVLAIMICLISVFHRPFIVADLLLWHITVNVHYSIYPGLTSGDYLLNAFMFYNIFLRSRVPDQKRYIGELQFFLHNMAVIAVMVHLCLLYFISGLTKAMDTQWQQGTAIYQTGLIGHFRPTENNVFQPGSIIALILNYFVMVYQLFFPVFVWLKPFKKIFLLCGVLIHLYIAFVMGIVGFGLVMLLPYVLFWPAED